MGTYQGLREYRSGNDHYGNKSVNEKGTDRRAQVNLDTYQGYCGSGYKS